MSISAIISAIIAVGITWGGFAYCISIAVKKND